MVATWRWPKLSYSALSTSRADMPRREALSLSMVTKVSTPLSCWSVSTSVSDFWPFIASARRVAQRFKSAWLSLLSVYWKLELACRPPARRSCTGLRNSCTPVTLASCGRRRAITACPATERWLAGFRLMNMKPPPARRPPVKPTTVATSGSSLMMVTSALSLPCMAWNEMLWSARIPPLIWPVSCCGKPPFGIAENR